MTHPCPDCGTDFELEDRTLRVRSGTCPGCHRTFTLLPHTHEAAGAAAPATSAPPMEGIPPIGDDLVEMEEDDDDEEETDGGKASASESPDTPVCGNCGSDLVFRAADEVTIEVHCPKCEETTRFRAEGAAKEGPSGGDDAPAPRESRGRRWEPRNDRPDRGRFDDRPAAKGCRLCGGPIDFQPTEDGGREGVCRNCGNRFRLPPREDGDRRGGGGYRGRPGGGDRRGPPRGGGGYRSRGPPRDRRGGGRPPARRRRDDE